MLTWLLLTGKHFVDLTCYIVGCCCVDVRSLVLKLDDYQIHDVANALKRFFRSLDSPLLTDELYSLWINAASLFLS